jgi:hypothetical protein
MMIQFRLLPSRLQYRLLLIVQNDKDNGGGGCQLLLSRMNQEKISYRTTYVRNDRLIWKNIILKSKIIHTHYYESILL